MNLIKNINNTISDLKYNIDNLVHRINESLPLAIKRAKESSYLSPDDKVHKRSISKIIKATKDEIKQANAELRDLLKQKYSDEEHNELTKLKNKLVNKKIVVENKKLLKKIQVKKEKTVQKVNTLVKDNVKNVPSKHNILKINNSKQVNVKSLSDDKISYLEDLMEGFDAIFLDKITNNITEFEDQRQYESHPVIIDVVRTVQYKLEGTDVLIQETCKPDVIRLRSTSLNEEQFMSTYDDVIALVRKVIGIDIYVDVKSFEITGFHIIEKKDIKDIINNKKTFGYKFLDDLNGHVEKQMNDNQCVERYLLKMLVGAKHFLKYDRITLRSEFKQLGLNPVNGLSVNQMKSWIQKFHTNKLSMFVLDPLFNVIESHKCGKNVSVSLMFMINNNHVYPIYNEPMKESIRRSDKLELKEVTWTTDASLYTYIDVPNDDLHTVLRPEDWEKNTIIKNNYQKLLKGEWENKNEIILIEHDIYKVAADVMKTTGYMVSALNIKDSVIEAFQHPINGQIIEQAKDYSIRKEICDNLYDTYKVESFKFKNQSFQQIAKSWFEFLHGKVEKSCQIPDDEKLIDKYSTKPLINTFMAESAYGQIEDRGAYDVVKCYSNGMIDMKYDYPRFTTCDTFVKYNGEEIVVGEYLIGAFSINQLGNVFIPQQIVGQNFIHFVLERGYMDKDNILFQRVATYSTSASTFSKFMQTIRDHKFNDDESVNKMMVKTLSNCFIGGLGKKYKTTDKGFVTDAWDYVCQSHTKDIKENDNWTVTSIGGLHFVRTSNQIRLSNDHSAINRQIISQGMVDLIKMIEIKYKPGHSRIVGYNTDAVFMLYPNREVDIKDYPQYKEEAWKPKSCKWFDKEIDPEERQIYIKKSRWNILMDYSDEALNGPNSFKDQSSLTIGSGGCGKSTLLKKKNTPGTLVFCYTNAACNNLRGMGVENVHTFDSFFKEGEKIPKNLKKIQIDEFSMIPLTWLNTLCNLKKNDPKLIIQMFGDEKQCPPVQDKYYDYLSKRCLKYLCNNTLIQLKYIEATARYTEEVRIVAELLYEHAQLPELAKKCPKHDKLLKTNVCFTNETRHIVNNRIAIMYSKIGARVFATCSANGLNEGSVYKIEAIDKKRLMIQVSQNGTKLIQWFGTGYFHICNPFVVGAKIIGTVNDKKKNVFNGKMCYIAEVSDDGKIKTCDKIGDEPNDRWLNTKMFEIAYCVTINKVQGITIEEDYNIWDLDTKSTHLTRNHVYVALTRARRLSQIHLEYTDRVFEILKEDPTVIPTTCIEPKFGSVYIMNNNKHNVSYIGMTINSIEERFEQHKSDPDDSMHKYDGEWTVEELCRTSYFGKNQYLEMSPNNRKLRAYEQSYINNYIKMGYTLINVQHNKKPKKAIEDIKPKVTINMGNVDCESISKRFHIENNNGCYRLRYKDVDGTLKFCKARYTTDAKKGEALKKMEAKRDELMKNMKI